MQTKPLTLGFIIVALLILPCAETASAESSVTVSPLCAIVSVDQPVEFMARNYGGVPPLTYQWYYTYLDPNVSPEQWKKVAVPGANNATFRFVASKAGRYGISISWTEAGGYEGYESFQPMGVVVTVKPLPETSHLNITFLTEENKTYTQNSVPLNFTLFQPTQWVAYSLDKQNNITIKGNTTLTDLTNGAHVLTLYASDAYGNPVTPQTIAFNIEPEPLIPDTIWDAMVILGVIAAVIVCIAVFEKKVRHR
ncbi:MAG: hypothetical protein NWE92_12240 [Candidatus Bathyarchaeota archaeon]|nr:hypothetical protein [Candidatus Bathyarchaeota archaeon]